MSRSFPVPDNEAVRLATVGAYHLLDTQEEEGFDRLARLGAALFDVPIVLISLLDAERQFFKSHIGVDACETSRDTSFCAHTIMQDDILVVPDAVDDPRFASYPHVIGDPHVRFYAGHPLEAPNGAKIGTVCVIDTKPRDEFGAVERQNLHDLSMLVLERMELHRRDAVRATTQARFESIAGTSPDAIVCMDSHGRITFWNSAATRLFGYSEHEALGSSADIIVAPGLMTIYQGELERLQAGESPALSGSTVELVGRRRDGTEFPAEYSLSSWVEGGTANAGAIIRDITDRKRDEQRLFRMASLDSLTDLPNRTAWRHHTEPLIANRTPATLALLDLDGFKEVNDTLGHSAGDAVLRQVAQALRDATAGAISVARLGGDEFVVLMPGNGAERARALGDTIVQSLSGTYEFAGQRAELGVSVGLALSPEHGSNGEELLGAADLALYRAKTSGRGQFAVFEPALREVAQARRDFQRELKKAYENGEFELFYQPQVSAADRSVVGAEALLRWNHPERGLLTPASFIDVLAEKPSAPAIGEWILRTACEQAARWRQARPGLVIGVNLFGAQLRSPDFASTVRRVLDTAGLPPEGLELELVETILTRNDRATLALLTDLRAMGVRLAFDDYGTGYASLSLLKRYPVTRLKIDRTFVDDAHVDREDAAVVRAILYLAETFGLETIAEGIETEEQLEFLRGLGCTAFQGYLVSEPVPAQEFESRFVTPAGPSGTV